MSLRRITLRDFVIVRELELDLSTGFSVLTGETGAGKSILIDALQLALGARAEAGVVREGAPRADVVVGEKGEVNWKLGLIFALVCGVLDTAGNVFILTGMRMGSLSVMGVLASLYPAGTIALAAIVLKERIALIQWIGMALAIAAIAMLSLT